MNDIPPSVDRPENCGHFGSDFGSLKKIWKFYFQKKGNELNPGRPTNMSILLAAHNHI